MAASPVTTAENTRQPVAPWWHTVLILLLIAIASISSAYEHGLPNAHLPGMSTRLSAYFTVLLVGEWLPVVLIWLALKRRGLGFETLVSGSWQTPGKFFRDLGFALGFLVVVVAVIGGLGYLLGWNRLNPAANVTPKTGVELLVFLILAATAGFCEELVFRGYLTWQFGAWTGSRGFAIVLQGIAFGLGHGFYGKIMVLIMVHGCLLGLLAHWRQSLRPGMLAHWLQDSFGGLAAFLSKS